MVINSFCLLVKLVIHINEYFLLHVSLWQNDIKINGTK